MILKDKKFDEIIVFLENIYPPYEAITFNNVDNLLRLADEYQVIELKNRCNQFLRQQPCSIEILKLAQKYNLKELIENCSKSIIKNGNWDDIMKCIRNNDFNFETSNKLLLLRLDELENLREEAYGTFRQIKITPG